MILQLITVRSENILQSIMKTPAHEGKIIMNSDEF